MNTLTARFLKYRRSGAKRAAPSQPPPPKIYPHSGFISTTETTSERMERLIEAHAAGYFLSDLDFNYMLAHRSFGCTHKSLSKGHGHKALGLIDRESHARQDRMLDCLFCHTKAPYGGMR